MRNRRSLTGFIVIAPSLALVAGLIGVSLFTGDGRGRATDQVAASVSRPNISVGDTAAEARLIRETLAKIAADRRAAAEQAAAEEAAARQAAAERRAAERAAARQAAAERRAAERASRDAVRTPAPVQAAAGGDDVWARLRQCEAGGRYDANTGNGYYGAYQFAAATWRSLGYPGLPHQAPPEVQDEAAKKLQARSGWGQWPACSRKIGVR